MTTAELNRKYFDSVSDSYDSKPWWAAVNAQITNTLHGDLPWLGIPFANTGNESVNEVRLLDYACGTGLMTRIFAPYVKQTRGIDISSNMVQTFNARAASVGLSKDSAHAVIGDLFNKHDANPAALAASEWRSFDLATVGFGFHHFEDVVFAARRLKERLRPGGVLLVSDFVDGGDYLADEEGGLIEESKGNHAVHSHGHEYEHSHGHGHNHAHGETEEKHHHHHHHHHHQQLADNDKKHDVGETNPEFLKKMNDSIVVPHFSLEGVRDFFTAAGFVDVDVKAMKERVYMEFAGKKLWRTVLFAKGRRPIPDDGNSEL